MVPLDRAMINTLDLEDPHALQGMHLVAAPKSGTSPIRNKHRFMSLGLVMATSSCSPKDF